jgi:predicted dehydrogenase
MDKIRLGIIGTGSVVREIYQYLYFRSEYSRLLSIEAAADPNPQALAEFCDQYNIPTDRRFSGYEQMLERVPLDAVQVNTPDSLHRAPTVFALEHGLDVMVPKPLAETVADAHAMIAAANESGRLIGVDFHKRGDPRIREAAARYRSGAYGQLQSTVWYMLDKLMVADPNRQPPFFSTPDFCERNSPISFLTVHMADALLQVVGLRPVAVRATGWSQKLPALKPRPCKGYDLCDTEIVLETGAVAHVITGWHLPDAAHSTTVQSSRLICTDGLIDLGLDTPGCREIVAEGIFERNPLFRHFGPEGGVSGYGIDHPGRLYQKFLRARNGQLPADERAAMMGPFELGFFATVVCEAATVSLKAGTARSGVTRGTEINVDELLRERLGAAASDYL